MFDARFEAQIRLVIQCLPQVAKQDCFAMKGGTAINLFLNDMPRVSVDIDLTYLPLRTRDESLRAISDALLQIKGDIVRLMPGSRVTARHIQGYAAKLSVVRRYRNQDRAESRASRESRKTIE